MGIVILVIRVIIADIILIAKIQIVLDVDFICLIQKVILMSGKKQQFILQAL